MSPTLLSAEMEYNHITGDSKEDKSLQLTVTSLEEAHVTLCKIKTSKLLEELTLVSPLPDIELVQLFQDGLHGNKSIKSLTLELTECSDEGIENVLNILNQNHTLQSLTLRLNNVSSQGATKIAHVLSLSCLTSFAIYGTQLDLHDLCIHDSGAFQIAMATRNCTALSELTISQSGITGVGVAKIMTSLQTHPSLITLNLSSNDIDIAGVKAIATSLPNMVTLKHLVLDNNKNIGDEGFKELSYALNHTYQLKMLSLKSCNITKVGVAILTEHLQNLTELILSGNVAIGNEGVELISKALEKTSTIQKLDLSRCGISDEGCHPLAQAMIANSSLSILCLHGNTICDSGILTLCDALEFNQ